MMEITLGLEHVDRVTVTSEMSPVHLAPSVVLSTPKMIELMEWAALRSVEARLGADSTSVGIHVNVSHESAAREHEVVTVSAKLVEIDRRRLTFEVSAQVGDRVIGRGTHQRFVIDRNRFGDAG
jgi:fluoroacetyl-CoA thioesterase